MECTINGVTLPPRGSENIPAGVLRTYVPYSQRRAVFEACLAADTCGRAPTRPPFFIGPVLVHKPILVVRHGHIDDAGGDFPKQLAVAHRPICAVIRIPNREVWLIALLRHSSHRSICHGRKCKRHRSTCGVNSSHCTATNMKK